MHCLSAGNSSVLRSGSASDCCIQEKYLRTQPPTEMRHRWPAPAARVQAQNALDPNVECISALALRNELLVLSAHERAAVDGG
jgi:hypothetical protein